MNNMIIDRYRVRAEMNVQVYKILELLGYDKRDINFIILSQEVENDNKNNQTEWNGFAKTVKTYNKKQSTITNEMIKANERKIKHEVT
mgnify:CR=1 FL=1